MIRKKYTNLCVVAVKVELLHAYVADIALCLSLQFFNGKLKRKPTNSDAEEKGNEKRQDQLRFVRKLTLHYYFVELR